MIHCPTFKLSMHISTKCVKIFQRVKNYEVHVYDNSLKKLMKGSFFKINYGGWGHLYIKIYLKFHEDIQNGFQVMA